MADNILSSIIFCIVRQGVGKVEVNISDRYHWERKKSFESLSKKQKAVLTPILTQMKLKPIMDSVYSYHGKYSVSILEKKLMEFGLQTNKDFDEYIKSFY